MDSSSLRTSSPAFPAPIAPEQNWASLTAKISSIAYLPSQLIGTNYRHGMQIIEETAQNLPNHIVKKIEKVELSREDGAKIQMLILYPADLKSNQQNCVLFHNPNTNTMADYLSQGLHSDAAPFLIMRAAKCPLILYDYRGTGTSRTPTSIQEEFNFALKPDQMPCIHTLPKDGHAVLDYALKRFQQVEVWGSSFGGAVATLACEAYLQANPGHLDRIKLYSLDSFTSTGAVALPEPLQFIAAHLQANLDAEQAMRALASRGLKIVLLSHTIDPLIHEGAKMASLTKDLRGRVMHIESHSYGHADLTDEMVRSARSC